MKKHRLLAIIALAIGIVAFNSCKKDDELTNNNETKALTSTFNPNEIENMDEYLLGFMKEIKTATRDSESMTIEDAEWHLSACLNFMYCNANINKTIVTYDTIYTNMTTNNGYVTMEEINNSLQTISNGVREIYSYSTLENKNIFFIMPEIIEGSARNGITIRTVVAVSDGFGYYYFDEDDMTMLDSIFPPGNNYLWNTEAIEVLQYYINYFKPTKNTDQSQRIYYVITNTVDLSPFAYSLSNRIFYTTISSHLNLDSECMKYFLDSYLGLIEEFIPGYIGGSDGTVQNYTTSYVSSILFPNYGGSGKDCVSYYHELIINYGQAYATQNPGLPID